MKTTLDDIKLEEVWDFCDEHILNVMLEIKCLKLLKKHLLAHFGGKCICQEVYFKSYAKFSQTLILLTLDLGGYGRFHVKKRLFFTWCGYNRKDEEETLLMKNRDTVKLYDFSAKPLSVVQKYVLLNKNYKHSPEFNSIFSYVTTIALAIQALPLLTKHIFDYENF